MPEKADADIDTKFAHLHECIARCDVNGVQDAIFDLSACASGWVIRDEVVERLLTLLGSEERYKSSVAGHVLNFFEFESPHLSPRQKWLRVGFLAAHGDQFDHVHSRQVVAELRIASGRVVRQYFPMPNLRPPAP